MKETFIRFKDKKRLKFVRESLEVMKEHLEEDRNIRGLIVALKRFQKKVKAGEAVKLKE